MGDDVTSRQGTDRVSSYTGDRPKVRALVPGTAQQILDVGCSDGSLGAMLLNERPGSTVHGVERDADFAATAADRLNRVHEGDALEVLRDLRTQGDRYDAVIFADLLEHLVEPWEAVSLAKALTTPRGSIVASLPNVAHISTIVSLLRGTWPVRDRGIHDRTHLRFFAVNDLDSLFEDEHWRITERQRVLRLTDTHGRGEQLVRYLGRVAPNLFTYQFLVRVERR